MTEPVRDSTPAAAVELFGGRVHLAERYWDWLADQGTVRGLIGPRESPRLWDRHIINCGVVGECFEAGERVVDVGSGAGLPGIPLAIARTDIEVVMVEPLLRRATFLEEVVADLGLVNAKVLRGRAEEKAMIDAAGGADSVTSRAVAPLDRLAKWCAPLVRDGGRMIAMKGSSASEEITTHRDAVRRSGLDDLCVRGCGADLLDAPSIVIVATKRKSGPANRRRANSRRHESSKRG